MKDFDNIGVYLIAQVLAADHLMPLRAAVDDLVAGGPGNRAFHLPRPRGEEPDSQAILSALACRLAGRPARLVRILAFDKTPAAN
jgi:hypothetical protein